MAFFDWFKKEEDSSGLGKFWKKLKNFLTGESNEDPRKQVEEVFQRSALEIVQSQFIPLVKSNITNGNHIYTGHSIDNIYAEARDNGIVSVGIRDAPYFGRVEFGTEPRTVDSTERRRLVDWVKKKDEDGDIIDPVAVAAAVADSIEESGNIEHSPFADALEELEGTLVRDITNKIEWEFKQ